MTILLKKCAAFACMRAVSELRWALGYRTCGRHGEKRESATGVWPIASHHAWVADVIGAADAPAEAHDVKEALR